MKLAIGFTKAQDEYDCPTVATGIMANNYFYLGLNPHRDANVIKDRMTRYMGFLDRIVPLVGQRWVRDWFPMIRQRNEAERDRNYSDDSDELVFARYFDMCRWMEEMKYGHGHINFALVPGTALIDFYDEVMSPKDPTESYQILQGYHTRPADAAHELWNLSRVAKANPELRMIFADTKPRDLKAALEKAAVAK